jgi:hypothetical protein
MSAFKKLTQQGRTLVARDEKGSPVQALALDQPINKKTWRKALKELTNDGADIHVVLVNLSKGVPIVHRFGGLESEPIIPSPEVMRAAAMDLHRIMHGKEVAETEVIKAEEEAAKAQQLAAYSTQELLAKLLADESARVQLKQLLENENYAEFVPVLPEGDK